MNLRNILLGTGLAVVSTLGARVTVDIDAGRCGRPIGDLHYGIFFEEINHAGDGGLYAELVRNRSFEDNTSSPEFWTALGKAGLKLVTNSLMPGNSQALQITFAGANDGVSNTGYWGINAVKDRTYRFSAFVRGNYTGTLTVALVGADGSALGSVNLDIKASDKWNKISGTLKATGNDPKAELHITGSKAGTLDFDCVSLFPPTYKDRENGLRPDLAKMLEDMHPSFVRFPGGCFVEGQNSGTGHNRFEWKKTIGPIENRPGHWNQNWNYRASDGFGFHEMLQLTEDLGAEPLFVVNIGMGHGWTQDYRDIDEYIQEALDAIEYCNGDVSTTYGAMRAANGHPEPFNLRLLEIGNENYQADSNQQSDHYAERYKAFYDAIKAEYPEITLIGNVEAWGTDNPSWRNGYPCEVVDEHYYRNPAWFVNQYGKYDNYDRSKPKVYVGEYAVTDNFGTTGNLTAALGEATYMLGMENNGDVCVMNSYAPIFVNENDQKWMPDMIRFNTSYSYGTPSYYIQQLNSTRHGDFNVAMTEHGNISGTGHKIGVSTWSTVAKYDNVKITDASGNVLFSDDFSSDSGNWTGTGWSISGGTANRTDASAQGDKFICDYICPDAYTLEMDATRQSGSEGFLIAFNYGDDSNYIWWNLGGWGNTQHAVEVCANGSKTAYDKKSGTIEDGRTYRIKVVVNGPKIQCYLDDELIHDISIPVSRQIYMASSLNKSGDRMYIKIVNNEGTAVPVTFNISNGSFDSAADVTVLTSASGSDENSATAQDNVVPVKGQLDSMTSSQAVYTVPAYSFTIIEMNVSDIKVPQPGGEPDAADRVQVEEFLNGLSLKLANLHATTPLPSATPDGAAISWEYESRNGGLQLSSGKWLTTLTVPALKGDKAVDAGTLTATVTYPAGQVSVHKYPVTLAPSDGMYGYLYCYMKSNKEITNYALGSREDEGKVFNELIGGGEIFDTESIAQIEHGTRDAFLGRGQRDNEYFITTTDMCNATSKVWNNFGLNLVRSKDLIHWEGSTFDFRKGKKIFSDPEAETDGYRTDAEYANIQRVWAPQWIWDATAFDGNGGYLVYYSLLSSNSGDNHDRIFYSYADRDFKTLTQPRLFYDPGYSVIDADIVYNPYDRMYYMCIKHEGASGNDRGVYILKSDRLTGGDWDEYLHVTTEGGELVEGATLARRIDEDAYNLYFMRYSGGSAYKTVELDHLLDNFGSSQNVGGKGNFQHGSVMTVTETEYRMLQGWSDLIALIAETEAIDTHVFDEALVQARAALDKRTVAELAEAIPAAIRMLKEAKAKYIDELMDGKDSADLTILLSNPAFANGGSGWLGTGFTAANSGVAEHWNKTFDTYQILECMPAGTYTFSCSGFYRYGGKEGYANHKDGSEELLAELYANDKVTNFMSLFDDSVPYTYDPYTYPDNVSGANLAFNTYGRYGGNAVTVTLDEPGDLRLGFRKSVAKANDWTCFDNFKLMYARETNGISDVPEDSSELVDVCTLTGVKLRSNVHRAEAAASLPAGIYLIGNRKVIVR